MTSPSRLAWYLSVVLAFGLGCIVFVAVATPWSRTYHEILLWPTVFLAVAAIAGEVKPLVVTAHSKERTLSTSAPFVLALIGVAGVGPAILVQAIASLADDVRQRRQLRKSLFNTAQYALAVMAARAVYAWLADVSFFGAHPDIEGRNLVALLVGGVAMIGVNWLLVAGVVSLATGDSLWTVLREDVRDFLVTNVVLLSVGGIAAIVVSDGFVALALLAAPVVGAHLFAAAAARHAHEATHDSLTGLGNRGEVDRVLRRALAAVGPSATDGPSLLLLDLDHFKDFNDTLGHPVGDRILREVAGRVSRIAPDGASIHRIGGDEFAVVVHGGLSASRRAALDLLVSFDSPIPVESLELLVRASIGVAVAPQHGSDPETLMKNADIALYHAKIERGSISIYSPDFDVNTLDRLQLLADLRTAIDDKALHVAYQPQIDLRDGRIVGVEALVRWDHPTRGPDRARRVHPPRRELGPDLPAHVVRARHRASPGSRAGATRGTSSVWRSTSPRGTCPTRPFPTSSRERRRSTGFRSARSCWRSRRPASWLTRRAPTWSFGRCASAAWPSRSTTTARVTRRSATSRGSTSTS